MIVRHVSSPEEPFKVQLQLTAFAQHDAVLDYYGRRLATCSSDKTIKIFEIEGESHKLTETLRGHEGAVWTRNKRSNPQTNRYISLIPQAHPKYGTILASSSYDGKVLIWREQGSQWTRVADFSLHTASVNIVSWSPHESGCLLACASSDGRVSILEFQEGKWNHQIFEAHAAGVNAVSWAPATAPGALVSSKPDLGVKRSPQDQTYTTTTSLEGHTDWVRDVAWSPSTILSKSYIASCSQDKTVRIWTCTPDNPNEWKATVLNFDAMLWRVSWSLSGNVLAVSGDDNRVSLWKEGLNGEWTCDKWIDE
ncbi:MAG: hypothetical protein Q9163_003280 [Psora crenata]